MIRSLAGIALLFFSSLSFAQLSDWQEPRHDRALTGIQPVAGNMKTAPSLLGELDLGRARPGWTELELGKGKGVCRITIIAGELQCYDPQGRLIWSTHPPGINFDSVVAAGDLCDNGHAQIALTAGRSAEPCGAALLVNAEDGSVLWRYDVEPMSYDWHLHVLDRAGTGGRAHGPKQLLVVMQGYPPDPKNGYCALFTHSPGKNLPNGGWSQKWRYDFPEYTAFPKAFQLDLDGEGFYNDIAIISHSRMWVLNRSTGAVRQFIDWDVSPANHRSYGLNQFVDLDGDGKLDFLCLGYFAKHYEVLLNKNGNLQEAWHYGWDDSVTTSNVAVTWPLPPYGSIDGDGKLDIVVSVFNGDGKDQWETRVHDAASGKLKYRAAGMIAARVIDVDGDGKAEILADRSDEGSDARIYGEYVVQHPKECVLLKAVDGKLQTIWSDNKSKAIREAPLLLDENDKPDPRGADKSVARIRVGEEVRVLRPDRSGQITAAWDPTSVAPPEDATRIGGIPELLAADFLGEGRCQLLTFLNGKAKLWRWQGEQFEQAGEYESTCLPVVADLDGDGKLDLALADVTDKHSPRYKAITPALHDKVLWQVALAPPEHKGLPAPRVAYMRAGRFTGRKDDDLYIWAGTPFVRSAVLRGDTGQLVWDRFTSSVAQRYWGPSMNLASVCDFNKDGKEDLIFTNPDYYCIASGATGEPLLGPLNPPDIFHQPSQGLYTMPVLLDGEKEKSVCLVNGHYFQAAMSLSAKPSWYHLPPPGQARSACEGFISLSSSTIHQWVMGFGQQNGRFACLNVADGSQRWDLDVRGSCSETIAADIDGDGKQEFVFGTSHGAIYAVGDESGKPRIVWKVESAVGQAGPILADILGTGSPQIVIPGTDGRVRVYGTKP